MTTMINSILADLVGTDDQLYLTVKKGIKVPEVWVGDSGNESQWTGGGGGGNSRVITSISTNTNAGAVANTDYIYLCSGTMSLTMPSTSGNTNRYTVHNGGVGTITIVGTVDGVVNPTIATQYLSYDLVSNGTSWNII